MLRNKEHDHFKIYQGVFDQKTLKTLYDLSNKLYFQTLDYPISTGKEADVFRATKKNGEYIAVKIYRIETSKFVKSMHRYIDGDPRFEDYRKTKRGIVKLWCQKEFRNLSDAYDAGLNVPKPIKAEENILLMEFIGKNGEPAPTLHQAKNYEFGKAVKFMEKFVDKLYKKCNLVHADMSEYNILINENKFYAIDMGQSVKKEHPNADVFLERDKRNIKQFKDKGG